MRVLVILLSLCLLAAPAWAVSEKFTIAFTPDPAGSATPEQLAMQRSSDGQAWTQVCSVPYVAGQEMTCRDVNLPPGKYQYKAVALVGNAVQLESAVQPIEVQQLKVIGTLTFTVVPEQ